MLQNDELRRTQIELEAARDRYTDLYNFSPVGHLTLDTFGTIVEANLRVGALLDVNWLELIGQPLARFVTVEDQDLIYRHCQEVLQSGTRQSCEVRLQKEVDTSRWLYLESLGVNKEQGNGTHLRVALLDISDRKRAEQKQAQLIEDLTRSQQHFQALFHWIPSAVGISTMPEGRFFDVNEGFTRLTGYAREEVIGRTTVELGLWADPSERAIVLREVQEQGHLHNREGRLRTKSGEIRSLIVSVHSIQIGSTPCLIYLAHDITERKRAEEALQKSEDRYRALYEDSPFMYFTVSTNGVILSVNRLGAESLDFRVEELIGRSMLSVFHEEDRAAARASLDRSLTNPTDLTTWEFRKVRKDGTALWVRETVRLVKDDCGALVMLIACEDITERKRAEEALKVSERQFASFMDNLPGFAWIKDAQGRHRYVNRLFQESLVKHVDWKEKTASELWPPEIAAQYESHDQKVLSSGAPLQTVEPYVQNGEVRHALVSKFPIEDHRGTPGLMGGVAIDITERTRAEEALRESESRFRIMADTAPTLIWMSGLDKLCIYFNQVWLDYTGRTMEQELGNGWVDGVHPEDFDRCWKTYAEAFDRREPFQMEYRLRKADGQYGWVFDKGVPRYFPSGEFAGYIGTCIDITERKWVEAALQSSDVFTRAVLNSLSAHVCVLDKEGAIVTTNDAWKEFARQHVDRAFIFGEVSDNYLDHCRHIAAGGTLTGQAILKGIEDVLAGSEVSFIYEYACHLPAEECWFLMRVTPLKDAKGVVISQTDISRRVRMGQALEQHALLLGEKQKELESLAGKLIEAQEEERKRIARELHDDFNQRLAALSVELESMERAPIALPESMARQLTGVRVQTGMLSDDLHDLAYRLHPSLLEHVGLEVAARDNVAEFAKRTGLSVKFTAREVPKTLSSEVATNLFRVLQESLQNVSKHAQATDVNVRLSGSSKGIGLSVRDNGKGFDVEDKNACGKGLGLVSMQERARGLGGFLRIHSLPRNGTKVCAWIPHSQKDA
jgi:PAS domain S-box-containing protein